MARFAFVPVKKYYNKDKFIVLNDEKAIREISALFTHFKDINGKLVKSATFIYNRELELVNSGEYMFLVSKDHPYLNKELYAKEMDTLVTKISKKENRAELTFMLNNNLKQYVRTQPKTLAETKELLHNVPYLILKDAFDEASKSINLPE